MQIVIDIPEKWFDDMVKEEFTEVDELCAIIQHGTPLPKGHGRLIDIGKVELVDLAPMRAYDKGWHNAVRYCVEILRNAPTVLEATKEGDR